MFDRNVAKILARCIEDVENGRLSVDECLSQNPEHADELRRHLELHEHMAGLSRPAPSSLGEQRGRQQLLTAVASQNIQGVPRKMIPNLLSTALAKAIAGALAGAVLMTSAAGASAAMGGPNVPGAALSALGLSGDHNDAATATATTTSHLDASATPNTHDLFGLCNAWSQGSDKGLTNKRDATAFKDLIKAAGADSLTSTALEDKVSQFCATVVKPGTTPSQTGRPTGTPGQSGNRPSETAGANGTSIDHPTGQPDGTPTPPVDHPTGRPDGTPTPR